jgi:hypothetical protein
MMGFGLGIVLTEQLANASHQRRVRQWVGPEINTFASIQPNTAEVHFPDLGSPDNREGHGE